jgi:hypothetical protein
VRSQTGDKGKLTGGRKPHKGCIKPPLWKPTFAKERKLTGT